MAANRSTPRKPAPSSSSRPSRSSGLRPAPHRFSLHDAAVVDASRPLSEVEAVALLTGPVRPSLVEVEAICQRLEAGVLARSVVRKVERAWASRAAAAVVVAPVLGGTQLELFAPKRRAPKRKAG